MAEMQRYSPNIIVVTVDPEISEILELLLKNLNYKIQLTNSSTGAFEKLKEKECDLMLLDISLPGMNIAQVLNYVKDLSPDTSVIVLAGYASDDDVTECLSNGAYDFFKKPFEKEEIMRRIKNALNQKYLKNELRNSREKLSMMERRYEYLVQNSPDFIYTLDDKGNFTYINDFSKNILGMDRNQLLRKHYTSVVYPDDVEKANYVFNERRAGSRDSKVTKLRLKKQQADGRGNSGKYVVVELKAKGIYDKSNKNKDKVFIGTQGIAKDISAYLQLEESLKIQKICFRQLFNNSHEAIVILDNQDNIIDANMSFEKMFNYSIGELKSKNIHNLIVPEDLLAESQSISSLAVSNGFFETESTRTCRDGNPVNVLISAYPVIYNNKSIAVYHVYKEADADNPRDQKIEKTLKKLRKAMSGIINAMVSTIEVRDPYTAGHQQRVADLARAIAKEMGLTANEIDGIRMAGTLHDLGKVNIPAEILSKPGRLSKIEFSLIKMHPRVAYDILKEIDFPWPIADMVHQHHERLDGSGYPQGLKGNEILLSGKILTVADVVEAIASHRPYRPALGIKTALDEIYVKRGIYYEPSVVDACVKLFEENRFKFIDETKQRREAINMAL